MIHLKYCIILFYFLTAQHITGLKFSNKKTFYLKVCGLEYGYAIQRHYQTWVILVSIFMCISLSLSQTGAFFHCLLIGLLTWSLLCLCLLVMSHQTDFLGKSIGSIMPQHKACIKLISLPLSPFSPLKKHLNPTCQFLYFSLFCTHLNNRKCKLLFHQLEIASQTIKTTPLKGRKTNSQTQTQRTLSVKPHTVLLLHASRSET